MLTLVNFPKQFLKELTYTSKKMEVDGRGRKKSKRTTEHCYELSEENGVLVVKTLQGFWKKALHWALGQGLPFKFIDLRTEDLLPWPKMGHMSGFRFQQRQLLETAFKYRCSGLIGAPTRYGKCLGVNTGILMYDGSVKKVQDVVQGDLVMGHDSKARLVSNTFSGKDIMYRIIPNKGEPFVVTQDHRLVLWRTAQGTRKTPRRNKGVMSRSLNRDHQEIIITPAELEGKSKTFWHLHKLISRSVEFQETPVPVDPYCYGLWIGDGHTVKAALTTADPECQDAWHSVVKQSTSSGNKRLLENFKINSRKTRLEVLAGIIDSDGYTKNGQAYAVIGKYESLMQDIQFLARSLGFRATLTTKPRKLSNGTEREYYELHISGHVNEIPVRLERKKLSAPSGRINHLATGFRMERLGEDVYYGFELAQEDKKFLLGNFMVTHNSTLMLNVLRAFPGVQTIVTMPGADLLKQCYDELQEKLPDREIKLIGAGSKVKYQSEDITVVSMDSLHKIDPGPVRLLLVDEPHAAVSESRCDYFASFSEARKYGFGATLKGRYDGHDFLLEGLIGPVLAQRTYREAVEEKAICPIKVMMVRWPLQFCAGERDVAYRKLLFENELVGRFARYLSDVVIPRDWQMLYFIKTEDQADFLSDCVGKDVSVAMAKKLGKKEREEMTQLVRKNKIKRVICSDIYVQGVTFHEVMVLVNCGGGGASTTTIQKPGRLAEVRPGKTAGLMVDFLFTNEINLPDGRLPNGMASLIRESQQRLETYENIGYDVSIVERNQIETWFLNQNIKAPT